MRSMTIRLSEEQYEQLQLASLIERRTMASIVRQSLTECLDARSSSLEKVKQAVAEARSRGAASTEAVLKVAEMAAREDDSEGLGKVQAVRRRGKGAGDSSTAGSADAADG
jgi:predicted transcriptional regulator